MSDPIKIHIGTDVRDPAQVLTWRSDYAINAHFLIIGSAGVGKSYRISRILSQFEKYNVRIHLFDPHDNVVTDENTTSSIKFSESSEYGVQPFRLSPDPDYGGVRKRVNSFIRTIDRHSRPLGVKQEAALRNLLYDLYEQFGFLHDDPSTWALKDTGKFPTLLDFKTFLYDQLQAFLTGARGEAADKLKSLTKAVSAVAATNGNGGSDNVEEGSFYDIKMNCVAAYENFIKSLKTGREITDAIKYDSKDVLKSLYNRIDSLYGSGIFKEKVPYFDKRKPIWRYNMASLSDSEQGFLVECFLDRIFFYAKQRGVVHRPDTLVVLDEAQKFVTDDNDNIINVIVREGRRPQLLYMQKFEIV